MEFGWTSDEVMRTPARRLFSMLDAARARRVQMLLDDAMIAWIPLGGKGYFDAVQQCFTLRTPAKYQERLEDPTPPDGQQPDPSAPQALEGTDAANAMRSFFR